MKDRVLMRKKCIRDENVDDDGVADAANDEDDHVNDGQQEMRGWFDRFELQPVTVNI